MCLYQNSRYRRLSDNRSSIRVLSAWARCGEQLTIGHSPLEHSRLIDLYVIVSGSLRNSNLLGVSPLPYTHIVSTCSGRAGTAHLAAWTAKTGVATLPQPRVN